MIAVDLAVVGSTSSPCTATGAKTDEPALRRTAGAAAAGRTRERPRRRPDRRRGPA